jgi:uncharacterized protein
MTTTSRPTGTLTDLLVPTFKQNLTNMSAWLDKIAGHDVEELFHCRLAPDMLPLASQIYFVSAQAREVVYRLQAKEIPQHVVDIAQEGREFGSNDVDLEFRRKVTLDGAKARIQEALMFLETLEPDALDQDGSAERMITLEFSDRGITFDLTGEQFVRDWALPQFYFHCVVAYSILRNAGVQLGKADYVPHMFAYLRPPSAFSSTTKGED